MIEFKTSRVMGGISTEADGGYMKVGVNDDISLFLSPSLVIDACS